MSDEPTSSVTVPTEPGLDSGDTEQQTASDVNKREHSEGETKQLDISRPTQGDVVQQQQSEVQAVDEGRVAVDESPAAAAVDSVQSAAVDEQQIAATQAVVDTGFDDMDNSEGSRSLSDTQLEAQTAELTAPVDSDVTSQPSELTDDASSSAALTDASSAPPSDSQLQPSHVSQSADTEANNTPTDAAAADTAHSQQEPLDLLDPSTQLVLTSPSVPLPPLQPAVPPRESIVQVRVLLFSAGEPLLSVVSVQIVREYLSQPKPFLGGYRHHLSGRVKHHASVQTERRQSGKGAGSVRVSRDTQTLETATRSAQSGRHVGTQMARQDYFIGEEGETGLGDRLLVPGEYVSSDVLEAQREERARQIQCWLRVCFAVRRMKQLKAANEQTESGSKRATELAAERKTREEEQQIHRRMHPKSAEDFKLLYAELNAWRQHEAARIHTLDLSDDERDKQLSMLLSKEVKLLQTIDRLKIRAARERKEEAIHRRLEMMQSPKEWTTSAGHHVEVVTPYTVRAQELTSLYQALLLPVQMHVEEKEVEAAGSGCLTWEGRVDVLLHCKYVVGEMASQLSADILQLIEREQEWVRRRHATPGWQAETALAGMRKRLAALFLQFVQTPAFNPESAVYVDSVGREGKQRMRELLNKPLPERERRRSRAVEEGQDRLLTPRVQT